MTVCSKRATKPDGTPETCGFFTPCAPCRCGEDVREAIKQQETRVARVPDSARESS